MSKTSVNPDPLSQKSKRKSKRRKRRLRRFLLASTALCLCIPVIAVVAPLHSRWFVFAGFDTVHSWFDDGQADHVGPTTPAGFTTNAVRKCREAGYDVIASATQPAERMKFGFADPHHPEAKRFREATADLSPEPFDAFEISRRIRALTRHETDFVDDDPWTCLQAARDGRGLWCVHFSRILANACSVRGYTTRIVSLSEFGELFDHALCEIFLPEYNKWVIIDTDFEVGYKRNGVWLDAREVQDAWRTVCEKLCPTGTPRERQAALMAIRDQVAGVVDIEIVPIGETANDHRKHRLDISPTGMNLELFEYVFLAQRDDYLGGEYLLGHPLKVRQVAFRPDQADDLIEICPEAEFVSAGPLYAPIQTSAIEVADLNMDGQLTLQFSTYTPRFEHFELRQDDGDWKSIEGHTLRIPLGAHKFELRSVNSFGVRGVPAKLEIVPTNP